MRSRDRVVISWPDPGDVAGEFALALIELVRLRGQRIEGVLRVEGGLLSRQRNEIVKHFLDDMTADWLFMIDSDETITPQAFDRAAGRCGGAGTGAGGIPDAWPRLDVSGRTRNTPVSRSEPSARTISIGPPGR